MEATVSSSEVDAIQTELDTKIQELDEVRETVGKAIEEVKREKSECFHHVSLSELLHKLQGLISF